MKLITIFLLNATMVPVDNAVASHPIALIELVKPTAKIDVDLAEYVGMASAGLACFPSGRLRLREFVGSVSEFQRLPEDTIKNNLNASRPIMNMSLQTLTLKSMRAKLCARKYGALGFGDRNSMTGEAKFVFEWVRINSVRQQSVGTSEITVKLSKREATVIDAIFPIALVRLLDQFVQ